MFDLKTVAAHMAEDWDYQQAFNRLCWSLPPDQCDWLEAIYVTYYVPGGYFICKVVTGPICNQKQLSIVGDFFAKFQISSDVSICVEELPGGEYCVSMEGGFSYNVDISATSCRIAENAKVLLLHTQAIYEASVFVVETGDVARAADFLKRQLRELVSPQIH